MLFRSVYIIPLTSSLSCHPSHITTPLTPPLCITLFLLSFCLLMHTQLHTPHLPTPPLQTPCLYHLHIILPVLSPSCPPAYIITFLSPSLHHPSTHTSHIHHLLLLLFYLHHHAPHVIILPILLLLYPCLPLPSLIICFYHLPATLPSLYHLIYAILLTSPCLHPSFHIIPPMLSPLHPLTCSTLLTLYSSSHYPPYTTVLLTLPAHITHLMPSFHLHLPLLILYPTGLIFIISLPHYPLTPLCSHH